jgi:hypothetical protein
MKGDDKYMPRRRKPALPATNQPSVLKRNFYSLYPTRVHFAVNELNRLQRFFSLRGDQTAQASAGSRRQGLFFMDCVTSHWTASRAMVEPLSASCRGCAGQAAGASNAVITGGSFC